jgi:hypothetical protein
MSQLCQHHRQQLLQASPSQAKDHWQQLMQHGHQAHDYKDYQRASLFFSSALEAAELLEEHNAMDSLSGDFLQMQFLASHNLSACFAAQGIAAKAAEVLQHIHGKLLKVCESVTSSRMERMGALGILDNSLFSLTSCLGNIGLLDEVYRVIRQTEQVARLTERGLWH